MNQKTQKTFSNSQFGGIEDVVDTTRANQRVALEQLSVIKMRLGIAELENSCRNGLDPVQKSLVGELRIIHSNSSEILASVNDILGLLNEQLGDNMTLR